jgi:hypothetical protein
MTKKRSSKKKKKSYKVVSLDLPLDTYKDLREVAETTNLTLSKVVNVLLVTYIIRERNSEEKA